MTTLVGDGIIVIDNNQVLKKKWAIKVDNQCYTSVVTMVIAFDQNGYLECNETLAPNNWKHKELAQEQIGQLKGYDKSNDIYDECNVTTILYILHHTIY